MSVPSTVLFVVMLATVVNGFPQEPCPQGWDLPLPYSTKCYKLIEMNDDVYEAKGLCEKEANGADLANGLPDIHTQRSIIDRFNRPIIDSYEQFMVIYGRESSWKNFGPHPEDKSECVRVNMRTLLWESVGCSHSQWMYALCEVPRIETE